MSALGTGWSSFFSPHPLPSLFAPLPNYLFSPSERVSEPASERGRLCADGDRLGTCIALALAQAQAKAPLPRWLPPTSTFQLMLPAAQVIRLLG